MALSHLLVRDVSIVNPGITTDGYGDASWDWNAATRIETVGWLAQTVSTEDLNGRESTSSYFSLTLPPASPVTSASHIEIEGTVYEVAAAPLKAWTPLGEHHIELTLRVVVG